LNIFISGSTGFVGINLIQYLKESINPSIFPFTRDMFLKNSYPKLDGIVIHLAGKAHDLKGSSNNDEYQFVNFELTKRLFNAFLESEANVFITLSSVKAVADDIDDSLTEDYIPNPITHYGKSKLMAEQYILSKKTDGKRVYILRPCMIHGPGNKGNLNLLYSLVAKGIHWPLGAFENKRSFCTIDNLMFIIKELIEREDIPSGIYNVADDVPLSTNEVVKMIAESKGKKARILNLSKNFIMLSARLGDFLKLPLNSERLRKLTESYVVSNAKIKDALGKQLPVSSKEGLIRTFQSFSDNA
jgi:nucleoside-diphosphate-sugar epimerase